MPEAVTGQVTGQSKIQSKLKLNIQLNEAENGFVITAIVNGAQRQFVATDMGNAIKQLQNFVGALTPEDA